MKRVFILSILFSSFSLTGQSQHYKNEIGINIFKYNFSNLFLNKSPELDYRVQFGFKEYDTHKSYDYNQYSTVITPQLFYSRKLEGSLRFRAEFQFLRNISNWDTYTSNPIDIGLIHTGSRTTKSKRCYIGSGLQYAFFSEKKLSPYVLGIGTFNAIFSREEQSNSFGQIVYSNRYDEFKISYTLGVGLQYKFSNRFSINMEITENSSFESHFLSRLSINYHF